MQTIGMNTNVIQKEVIEPLAQEQIELELAIHRLWQAARDTARDVSGNPEDTWTSTPPVALGPEDENPLLFNIIRDGDEVEGYVRGPFPKVDGSNIYRLFTLKPYSARWLDQLVTAETELQPAQLIVEALQKVYSDPLPG
jgi:hypothetical protein